MMMKRILFIASLLIGLALAFAPVEVPRVDAQTFAGQPSPGYVEIGQGPAQVKWTAVSGCALTSAGAMSCPITAITSAAATDTGTFVSETSPFTVQPSNCNNTFLFSSTSQATVTAAAGSTFPANCRFWIRNIGAYTGPGSARGLLMNTISGASFPTQGFVLYPGQATEFSNVGASSAWIETGYDWRKVWKIPSNSATLFADATSGSNVTADCLAATTGACATLNASLLRIYNNLDLSNTNLTLSTTGSFPSNDVLFIQGPFRGQLQNGLIWQPNATTTVNVTAVPCLRISNNSWVVVAGNVTCSSSNVCWSLDSNGDVYVNGTNVVLTCTMTAGIGLAMEGMGTKFEFQSGGGGLAFGGTGGQYLIFINNGSLFVDGATTFSLNASLTLSGATIFAEQFADANFGNITWNLNAHTITGTRYICDLYSMILGTSGAPNTYFPGSVNGSNGTTCVTP